MRRQNEPILTAQGFIHWRILCQAKTLAVPVASHIFQTQEHIILECSLGYEGQQEVLLNVSRSYLPDILSTKEGITALNEPIGTPERSLRQGNHEV